MKVAIDRRLKFLRWLRLGTRLFMLGVLGVTALLAASFSGWVAHPKSTEKPDSPLAAVGEIIAGGPTSISILGFELLDPALALLALAAEPRSWAAVLQAVAIPIGVAVLFGRVFCAYLCPVGWLATALARLRARLARRLALPTLRGTGAGRFLLALLGILAVAGFSSSACLVLLHLHPQRLATSPFDQSLWFFVFGSFVAFCASEILLAPGLWCASLCPSGALYDLAAKRRLVTLAKTGEQPCPKGCKRCDEVCWLHLTPRTGEVGKAAISA